MDNSSSPPPSTTTTNNHRIKLNIGGTLFETTHSTVPNSLLTTPNHHPHFIDRDPHLFSSLLSHLRNPHHHPHLSFPHLLRESHFYNLHPLLNSSLTPPPLTPFDSSLSHTLSPPSHPFISSLSTHHSTLILSHSNLISSYHLPTLTRTSTFPTHFDIISSLHLISSEISAVGSDSYSSPGLHFYSLLDGKHVGESLWWDPSDPRTHKARVTAVESGSGVDSVFASFECRHGENAVLMIDKMSLKVVGEFGRQPGNAAKSAAMRKLTWTPALGLLVGSSVVCGAFGYSGYVRVWDPRAGGEVVWETSEPGGVTRVSRMGDPMGDVDVDVDGLFLAKVGSKSGELGVADMRKLGSDPWVYLDDPNPGLRGVGVGGQGVVVHCYKGYVFVGKEGGLEAWSRVEGRELKGEMIGDGDEEKEWGVYRRNYVDKVEDAERGLIWKIESGGNRLFVCRENVEGVEVWESSDFSGVKMITL